MSSHLNLALIPGPIISKRSGRLAEELASAPTVKRAPAGTAIEPRTSSQLLSLLAGAPEGGAVGAEESVSAITLSQLQARDQLLIRTAHSTYIFLALDPARRLGLVVGGVFGDYAAVALIESSPPAAGGRLQCGARVRFNVQSPVGDKLVTTSAVTELIHRKRETGSLG